MSIRSLRTSTLTNQTNYPTVAARLGGLYPSTVQWAVVAGGGGGGRTIGGGGGAGGILEGTVTVTSKATYTVTVGAGGAAYTNGSDSAIFGTTVTGGGRGSEYNGSPNTGGSGGGGSGGGAGDLGDDGAAGTTNQGHAGGNRQHVNGGDRRCGGGGGALAIGGSASNSFAGTGGPGRGIGLITSAQATSATVGQVLYDGVYFGGGGGGNAAGGTEGLGGVGGGGNAGISGSNATANTGGGGGGGETGTGGAGGSGVAIFRAPSDLPVSFSGGVTWQSFVNSDGTTAYVVKATSTTSETVTVG